MKLFGAVLDSMSEGVSISDEQGFILYTNPAEDRMFGYEPGELRGQHVTAQNAYPPEENAARVAAVIEELKSRGAWTGEWLNRRKDGTSFYTFARITAVPAEGKVYWVAVQEDVTERKVAELERAALEARFRQLADASPALMWVGEASGNCTFVNATWQNFTGRSIQKEQGMGWAAGVHPEDLEGYLQAIAQASQSRIPFSAEYRLRDWAGRWRWMLASGAPRFDHEGDFAGFIATCTDIDHHKRLEAELRFILDSTPAMIGYVDRDMRYVRVNQQYAQWVGVPAEALRGRTMEDALGSEQFERIRPHVDRALQGEAVSFETTAGDRFLLASYRPQFVNGGTVGGFVALIQDITARKTSELELARVNAELRRQVGDFQSLLDVAPIGIEIARDPDCRQVTRNGYLSGLGLGEGTERILRDGKEVPVEELPLCRAVRTGRPVNAAELTLAPANGTEATLLGNATPLMDEQGRVRGGLAAYLDITERKRAEDRQREVERQLMLLVEASSALLAPLESEDVLQRIVDLAQRVVEADALALWRATEGRTWRVVYAASLSAEFIQTPVNQARERPANSPLMFDDLSGMPAEWRTLLEREGIRSALAIPLCARGAVTATVAFYWHKERSFTGSDMRVAAALANLGSAVMETAALYEAQIGQRHLAEASERRAAFLAEAGAVLSSSLDYEATLKSVARLAIPSFADWAAVDIADEHGVPRRVAVAHTDPEKVRLAYEIEQRYERREDDPSSVAFRSGRSVLLEITEDLLARRAHDSEQMKLIQQLGLHSVIVAPMTLGQRVLGLVTFVTAESGRRYTASDLQTAEELARRAATAIEHARLYRDAVANEQRLQLTLESAALGTFSFNPATQELTCDTRCRGLFGLPPGEGPVDNAVVESRIHPEDREVVIRAVASALDPSDAGEFETEYRVIPGEGEIRWVIAKGRAFFEERAGERRPVRFMGTILDITERKRAEAEKAELLRREREAREVAEQLNRVGPVLAGELDRQRLMQSVTDIAVSLTGAQFGALFINDPGEETRPFALYALSGAAREWFGELPRLRQTPLFEPTFHGKQVVRIADLPADERYGLNAPHGGVPAGHPAVRSYLAAPLVSRSGEVLGALLFGHGTPGVFQEPHEQIVRGIAAQAAIALDNARLFAEIESAKQALQRSNEDLRRANEDLNQFAYSASHDLQEPLRMVALYSQILQRNYGGKLDEDADTSLTFMVQGARRMEMLIRDLLAYTQAVSATDVQPEPVDAGEVLHAALTNLQSAIADSGAVVRNDPLPELLVSRVHLLQLFQNLIGNSIKYRGHAPLTIHVAAEREGAMWRICVRDNGIGIDPQYADRIFGIFKRLHTNEQYSGTGIGLAICQKIVDRYRGRIWVESEGPDRGSTFCFTLPGAGGSEVQ